MDLSELGVAPSDINTVISVNGIKKMLQVLWCVQFVLTLFGFVLIKFPRRLSIRLLYTALVRKTVETIDKTWATP
jgi:hypothetical protein